MLSVLAAAAILGIRSTDVDNVDRIAALCKSADQAQTAANGLKGWVDTIDDASKSGGLAPEQRREIFKMCAMYSAGKRDAAEDDMKTTEKQLQNNTEQLEQLLKQQHR